MGLTRVGEITILGFVKSGTISWCEGASRWLALFSLGLQLHAGRVSITGRPGNLIEPSQYREYQGDEHEQTFHVPPLPLPC